VRGIGNSSEGKGGGEEPQRKRVVVADTVKVRQWRKNGQIKKREPPKTKLTEIVPSPEE